jgi:hypothetical protein
MTTRNCQVVLSSKEKQKLDDVAKIRYGTEEVPYGIVVDALCSDYLHDVEINAADDTEHAEAAD